MLNIYNDDSNFFHSIAVLVQISLKPQSWPWYRPALVLYLLVFSLLYSYVCTSVFKIIN